MSDKKLVDITQLESDLTSLANAIREKSEINDPLLFPSGFANAISEIRTSAMPTGLTKFTTGTFTLASDLSYGQSIEHGLGVAPNFFYVIVVSSLKNTTTHVVSQQFFKKPGLMGQQEGYRLTHYTTVNSGNILQTLERYMLASNFANETTFAIKNEVDYDARYRGGSTYFWICGIIDGLK